MQALCTFSHTAPRFTENEWSQERRELNGSEREAIDADVFGTGGLLFETEAMREKGLVDFEAAMSCITAFNKTTYLKAMHICPDLVESETPAIMFLRCEEFDAKTAAARMAKYWDFRYSTFGERAFLPMDQTGQGALTEDDIACLKDGHTQLLPADKLGRPIIYVQRGCVKIVPEVLPSPMRCLFYMFHVVAQDEMAQKHGCVFVFDKKDEEKENFHRKLAIKFYDFLWCGCPIRIRAGHFAYPGFKAVGRIFLPTILAFTARERRQRIMVHSGCPKEILMDLEGYGIQNRGVPTELGGLFDHGQFLRWVEVRRTFECHMTASAAVG